MYNSRAHAERVAAGGLVRRSQVLCAPRRSCAGVQPNAAHHLRPRRSESSVGGACKTHIDGGRKSHTLRLNGRSRRVVWE